MSYMLIVITRGCDARQAVNRSEEQLGPERIVPIGGIFEHASHAVCL